MSNFYERFKKYIEEQNLVDLDSDQKIIIGVSGGADSVCLLLLFNELRKESRIQIQAVHVNHNLRGEEALEDQKFTELLAKELEIELKVFSEDVKGFSEKKSLSLEEAGREIRYERFREEALKNNAKIAVAHHADDNAETIIFNIIRGCDLQGLKGIQPKTKRDGYEIIRPLLFAERHEIEEYLTSQGRTFRTDATNADTAYSRNKIRHDILKEMAEINPQAVRHINRMAESVKAAEELLDKRIEELNEKAVCLNAGKVIIDAEALKKAENTEIEKLIYDQIVKLAGRAKDISEKHVKESAQLLKKETGKKVNLPYGIEAVNVNGKLVLKKTAAQKAAVSHEIVIKDNQQREFVNDLEFVFETVSVDEFNRNNLTQKNKCTKAFDYDKITDSLFLRTRRPGDSIVLKNGTKSLNRFFIDNKIPKDERDSVLVLASGNKILWIIGFRISEEFKITGKTKKALIVHVNGEINERY